LEAGEGGGKLLVGEGGGLGFLAKSGAEGGILPGPVVENGAYRRVGLVLRGFLRGEFPVGIPVVKEFCTTAAHGAFLLRRFITKIRNEG
jgi:hypothetical protein